MASDNLEDVLTKSGVDSNLTNSLMMEGWTSQAFRMAAADSQGFEDVLQEWSSSHPLSTLQKACLRTAFQSLQPQGPSSSAFSTPTVSATTPAGSWAEAFPPKLENAVLQAMKQKIMANYPSELIHADLFPSTRLVSLVHDQLTKKVWKWVPWKYRISLTRSEEISSNRAQKTPKIDHLGLHALLFDDPPSLDVSNNAMGVNSIRNMLEVHDRAIALCQGAHLANLKAYTHKFIGFLTAKYDGDLRNPSVLEAQHADKKIWTVIAELMERGWNMDDCLHEMTNLRHDLPSLLQPRPRVFKTLPSPTSQTASPRLDGQKGKGQGKSKGKQNSGKSKGKIQWVTEVQRDGVFKQLCMRYQVGKCQNSNCSFQHVCAYPVERPVAKTMGRCHTLPHLTDSPKGKVIQSPPCMTNPMRMTPWRLILYLVWTQFKTSFHLLTISLRAVCPRQSRRPRNTIPPTPSTK